MLPEISLNILDISQNSISAKATQIKIMVWVNTFKQQIKVQIKDNGTGMDAETVKRVTDPFYTTRTTRKVGLGIPFFKQEAECTGGSFSIFRFSRRLLHFFTQTGNMCHNRIVVVQIFFLPDCLKQLLGRYYRSLMLTQIPQNIKLDWCQV